MKNPSKNLHETIWKRKSRENPLLVNRIREAVRSAGYGFRCLDIGCGDGRFGAEIKGRYTNRFGVDFSISPLKRALLKGNLVLQADMDGPFLPFREDAFDLIACLDVIEHVYDPEKMVWESYRLLRLNGMILVTTPNIRFIDYLNSLFLQGKFPKTCLDRGGYDGGHIHYFTFRDVRGILERSGFAVLEERGYDLKGYSSAKVLLFRIFARWFEKKVDKEFFCPGMLVKGVKL